MKAKIKLDYPNAFKVQARMTDDDHRTPRCSTLSGGKMFLCDCDALYEVAARLIDEGQAIVDDNGFVRVKSNSNTTPNARPITK